MPDAAAALRTPQEAAHRRKHPRKRRIALPRQRLPRKADAQTEASAETSETDGEKIVVTIGDFPNKEADPALWEVYQGYVEKFKEIRPDVEIIQDEKSYSVDSFATTAATGQLANLFRVAFTEPQACIDSGYVRDVTDIFVERGYADGLNDDVMEMLTADGKYYGIPMTGYSMGMWYNVNLFKQAGLVNEDGTLQYPTTWDEVIETAQIIKEKTGQAGFGFQGMGNQAGWVMQNLDWAYGAELMVEEEDGSYKATFATPELEEAFQIYYDMKWKYDVLPANTQMERADVVRMMATDQLGMCVCAEDWWDCRRAGVRHGSFQYRMFPSARGTGRDLFPYRRQSDDVLQGYHGRAGGGAV